MGGEVSPKPMRTLALILLPALALIIWLVAAQLPRWTAPQAGWFAPDTPGVCAAVESLRVYQAQRADPTGIGVDAARAAAEQTVEAHYDAPALELGEPLAVDAALPGEVRHRYYVIAARLSDTLPRKIAVIYVDADSGAPRDLITATEDAAVSCDFDLREALVAAAKSPPLLLLIAYVLIAAGALVVRRLWNAKGSSR